MKYINIFLVLCTLLITNTAFSQSIFYSQEQIEAELEKRDIDIEELTEALEERGIRIDKLTRDNVTPQDIATIQEVILEIEEEKIEAEKKKKREEERLAKAKDKNGDEDDLEETESDSLDTETIVEVEEEDEEEEKILIYGQNLFRDKIISVDKKADEIRVPDSYVLGPGDEIVISVWGKSQFDNAFTISPEGYIIVLDGAKRVFLKGMNLATAKEKLFSIFREYYSFQNGQFDVAVNFSRTIRISIYGAVNSTPGSFAIPAFNSAFKALSLVEGTDDIGSLRKIKLQKNSGQSLTMDVYEFMLNPSISSDYYLEDNDVIVVPVADKIISVTGAIRRPMKYELIEKEGVKELLEFAGGFSENAFQKKIQIKRFENDENTLIDIDWRAYEKTGRNFELLHGDSVYIETIETEYNNYVTVIGAVSKPGQFQRSPNMKLLDLIEKTGLKETSNTELVYLTRIKDNGSTEVKKLYLSQILKDKNHPQNILLNNKDEVEIWSKDRFTDKAEVSVDGSVRFPGKLPYDASQSIRVTDAITISGGLSRDASNYAIIHRNDPLNPKLKYYKTITHLDSIFMNPDHKTNFILNPFDSLVVKSNNTFIEESYVRIEGAVNSPGEYQYGIGMNIKDILTLSGGFKIAASTNNIEVSRVVIEDNKPTRTVVAFLELDREFNVISGADTEYLLEPFDNIAIRYIKEFQLQQRVFLKGEVAFPGPYAIAKENEKIRSIINRAGGLTDEAFPAGATLLRTDQDYGSVVIKLDEIINNPESEFNFFVKNGDEIFVPKIKEFVTISGATRAQEIYSEETINEGNEIHVPYHKGKDAIFYINEYAGGLNEQADVSKIFVEHANGEIKKPKIGFLKRKYPKVYQGSVIRVGFKSEEKVDQEKEKNLDWNKILSDSVAQAMGILSLLLLVQNLD